MNHFCAMLNFTYQKGSANPNGSGECSKTGAFLELLQLLLPSLEDETLKRYLPGIQLDRLKKKKNVSITTIT